MRVVEADLSEYHGDRRGGENLGLHVIGSGGGLIGQCMPHNVSEPECVDISGVRDMVLDRPARHAA